MNDSYFRKIDELREKFDAEKPVSLKEACWILWADQYVCSYQYLKWKKEMEDKGFSRKKLPFPMWNGAFENWLKKFKESK